MFDFFTFPKTSDDEHICMTDFLRLRNFIDSSKLRVPIVFVSIVSRGLKKLVVG